MLKLLYNYLQSISPFVVGLAPVRNSIRVGHVTCYYIKDIIWTLFAVLQQSEYLLLFPFGGINKLRKARTVENWIRFITLVMG